MISPVIAAIAIAVLAALSFVGGFKVADWRSGAQIARLESENAVLHAANGQCQTDIQSVRAGVKAVVAAADQHRKAADAEMQKAQVLAAKHSATAIKIKESPLMPGESMCDAITREQGEYLAARRGNDEN